MRTRFCFSLLVTLIFVTSSYGRSFRLTGTVMDEARQPLWSANVKVSGIEAGTSTDEEGRFSLMFELEGTTVSVEVSYIGFLTFRKSFKAVSDSLSISIYMEEDQEMLSEVSTQAQRRQETTMERIDVEHLKSVPSTSGGGIESLIAMQPGVAMNNELSSQYSVRGGNYDENCVYVNSMEVYRPLLIRSGEQEGLSFVNPDLVESVSFSSGGYGVQYGDKMSSVLDIRYKKPTRFEGSASVSLLGATAYIGQSGKRFSQVHGFRYKTASYLLGTLETEGEYDPSFVDYQTFLTYDFNSRWELSFLGNISRNDYRFRPVRRQTRFGTMTETKSFDVFFDGQEKDLFMTYSGALSLNYKPTRKVDCSLLFSSFHTAEDVAYDIGGSYWLSEVSPDGASTMNLDQASGVASYHEHARDRLRATVMNVSQIGKWCTDANTMEWGVSFQRERIDDGVNEWEWRDSAGYSLPTNSDFLLLYENLSADELLFSNRFSAHLQNTYTLRNGSGRWLFAGGVRLSYWNYNREWLPSVRGAITWFPKKHSNIALRLAGGRYYQAPFYKEIRRRVTDEMGNSTLVLNRDIRSPRSNQILVANDIYFRKWNRPFKFSTELYYKYMDRIIPYVVDNTQITYAGENKGDGYAVGFDMKLFGELVPGTDSWVSFSLMQTKEDVYGDGLGYIYRPTDQRYNFSLFFQDYFPGFDKLKFNLKFIWADGMPFGPPNNDKYKSAFRMSDYRRVDLGVAYQLRREKDRIMERKFFSWMKILSFDLDVFNLLGIGNVNSYYWVTDVSGQQYAVPNYLTGRRVNFKIQVDF